LPAVSGVALLPADEDLTEPLAGRDVFLTQAYLILSCAIIEEFIENCFVAHVERALAESGETVAPCFVPLATKFSSEVIAQIHAGPAATEACPMLASLYKAKIVRQNNGVKRDNLVNLAKPLGLTRRVEEECEALILPADTLGARRGAIAHLGTVTDELRPAAAQAMVLEVIDALPLLVAVLDPQP
jgi:hypothetical protein